MAAVTHIVLWWQNGLSSLVWSSPVPGGLVNYVTFGMLVIHIHYIAYMGHDRQDADPV